MRERRAEAAQARAANVQASRSQLDHANPPPKRPRVQQENGNDQGATMASSEQSHEVVSPDRQEALDNDDEESDDGENSDAGNVEDEEQQYFVNVIHDVRYYSRRLEYLIEWEHFPAQDHWTWEPTKHLPSQLLKEFKEDWLRKGNEWPGPSGRAQNA